MARSAAISSTGGKPAMAESVLRAMHIGRRGAFAGAFVADAKPLSAFVDREGDAAHGKQRNAAEYPFHVSDLPFWSDADLSDLTPKDSDCANLTQIASVLPLTRSLPC